MLKTSPVLSPSANTSPTTFRYAPASSPKPSPHELAARLRRSSSRSARPSPSSMSPATRDPVRSAMAAVAGVDAGSLATPAIAQSSTSSLTSSSATQSSEQSDAATAASSKEVVTQLTQPDEATTSPTKRRGSPPATAEQSAAQTAETAQPNQETAQPSKRQRADEQPPKVLPQKYEFCPVEDMVELIANMLSELINTNDAIRTSSGGLTRFHSRFVEPLIMAFPRW